MTPQDILTHYDEGRPWPADRADAGRSDVAAAYQDALAVRALRCARGERPMGYKIGFTNRTIWPRYGVFAPIWGTVWNTTLTHAGEHGAIDLTGLCQPRLEPELVFGIAAAPPADPTLEQLFDCIAWCAPGFEIVQSHTDWKFTAAETVADGALHAHLLVGRQTPVRELAGDGQALDALLAARSLRLVQAGESKDQGSGCNVLDGPLHALLHFVQELQRCPGAPRLQAGEVVTTGTWTDAWPVVPGQRWRADFDTPLLSLEVAFRPA